MSITSDVLTNEALVQIDGVHKYFGEHHVLRGIDMTVLSGPTSSTTQSRKLSSGTSSRSRLVASDAAQLAL